MVGHEGFSSEGAHGRHSLRYEYDWRGGGICNRAWPFAHVLEHCWTILAVMAHYIIWSLLPTAPVYGARHSAQCDYPEALGSPHGWYPRSFVALSPLYNQVVEFNHTQPSEIIGDLATRWEVTEDGLTCLPSTCTTMSR